MSNIGKKFVVISRDAPRHCFELGDVVIRLPKESKHGHYFYENKELELAQTLEPFQVELLEGE